MTGRLELGSMSSTRFSDDRRGPAGRSGPSPRTATVPGSFFRRALRDVRARARAVGRQDTPEEAGSYVGDRGSASVRLVLRLLELVLVLLVALTVGPWWALLLVCGIEAAVDWRSWPGLADALARFSDRVLEEVVPARSLELRPPISERVVRSRQAGRELSVEEARSELGIELISPADRPEELGPELEAELARRLLELDSEHAP